MNTQIEHLFQRIPHVDREWAQQVMTELALRDVSGENIGAALLEVESHMAEHGGDVREVFGDPQAYAAALELPNTEKRSGWQWAGVWLPAILLFAGMSVMLSAVVALFGGSGLPVFSAALVLVVLAIAAVAVVKFELLRFMVHRPVTSTVTLAVLTAGVGILASLLPGPTLDLNIWVALPSGAAHVLLALLLLMRMRRQAETHGVRLPRA